MSIETIEVPCTITFEGIPSEVAGSGEIREPYALVLGLEILGVEFTTIFHLSPGQRMRLELALERKLREERKNGGE